ncbi:nitroreductase family deazaflavin-dependent oxidoreductase [Streptomyces sp. NPDC059092]|uniref:nitroreductase family deazaflavin-dependent oxidoreductase n=1 Tax=Streptomyces sp. NPDC059092 TaxID=3346725 RepID=UPI0036AD01E0
MTARASVPPRQRARNRIIILLQRMGLSFGPMHLLTVQGRRSGLPRTTPVAPVVVDGTCYILQAYPESDWVKNARAAGHGVLVRGRRARQVELVELPEEERGRVLREFPVQNPRGVGAFVRNGLVDSGSPEHFEAAAARCPVFRVVPRPR